MSRPWLGPVLLAAMVVFALAVYPSLPEQVPTHWGLSGEPDDWMPKWPGAFLPPLLGAGVWVLLLVLRRIDPRRAHYESFRSTFWLLLNVLLSFFALLHVVSLGTALGWPLDAGRAILLAVGLLFIALGSYLPRVRSNWWIGIRTPWTLESERVWRETHRPAGRTFTAGGRAGRVARGGVRPRGLFLPGVPPSAARAPRLSCATLHVLRELRASMRVPDEGSAAPPGGVLTGATARQKRGRGGLGAGTRGRAGPTRLVEATVDQGRGGPGRGMAPGHLHRVPKKERGLLARAARGAVRP